jgi:hypothetical protein
VPEFYTEPSTGTASAASAVPSIASVATAEIISAAIAWTVGGQRFFDRASGLVEDRLAGRGRLHPGLDAEAAIYTCRSAAVPTSTLALPVPSQQYRPASIERTHGPLALGTRSPDQCDVGFLRHGDEEWDVSSFDDNAWLQLQI